MVQEESMSPPGRASRVIVAGQVNNLNWNFSEITWAIGTDVTALQYLSSQLFHSFVFKMAVDQVLEFMLKRCGWEHDYNFFRFLISFEKFDLTKVSYFGFWRGNLTENLIFQKCPFFAMLLIFFFFFIFLVGKTNDKQLWFTGNPNENYNLHIYIKIMIYKALNFEEPCNGEFALVEWNFCKRLLRFYCCHEILGKMHLKIER